VTVLEQLDDLGVDRPGSDRIEAGRRLVVQQNRRLGRHRARDRHSILASFA
jgi:hypothetical protein